MRKTLSLLLALVMVLSLTACAETGELSIKYDETTEISLSKEYEELKWESSDTAIATVENNMVKGVGPGQATLTATSNSKVVAKYTVSVEIVEIAEIFLQSDELEIKIGEAVDLTYSLFPTDASAYGLTYTSINPDIATVDENGHIEAVAVGKTNIVLSTASGKTATCQVIVKEPSAIEQLNEDEKLLFDVMVEKVLPSFYNAPAARIRKIEDFNNDEDHTKGMVLAVSMQGTNRLGGTLFKDYMIICNKDMSKSSYLPCFTDDGLFDKSKGWDHPESTKLDYTKINAALEEYWNNTTH